MKCSRTGIVLCAFCLILLLSVLTACSGSGANDTSDADESSSAHGGVQSPGNPVSGGENDVDNSVTGDSDAPGGGGATASTPDGAQGDAQGSVQGGTQDGARDGAQGDMQSGAQGDAPESVGTAAETPAAAGTTGTDAPAMAPVGVQPPAGIPVESITLGFYETAMHRGDTLTLSPIVHPSSATNKTVSYHTDDPSVVTVTNNGVIYAAGAGSANVSCVAANGVQVSCKITVTVPVQSVSISVTHDTVNRGDKLNVQVMILPADATDKNFTVSSGNEDVLKQTRDVWLAHGAGTASLIAVASSGVTGSVEITVVVPVESVVFDMAQMTLNRYISVLSGTTVYPADATDKSLSYRTDDESVVTISENGFIYAAGAGTTTITAIASNGMQSTCEVTVIVPVSSISVEVDRYRYKTGETAAFTVTVYPDDATDKSYAISITGTGGSLDGDAVLCVSSGKTTITAVTPSGVTGKRDIDIVDLDEYASEVVRLVNIERANNGVPALSGGNGLLNTAAMIRADEIIVLFSHTRPDGSSCFTVFDDVGLSRGAAGENIYSGPSTPKSAVDGWMNSEGHRNNILNPTYTHIGVGVAMDSYGGLHWVQMFIK